MTESTKKPEAIQLTAEDILRGGDSLERLELPELTKDGRPGVVFLRQLGAGDVIAFMDHAEGAPRNRAILALMAKAVVTEQGEPVFADVDDDALGSMPMGVFNKLAGAVTAMANLGGEEGNELSEVNGDASPTD